MTVSCGESQVNVWEGVEQSEHKYVRKRTTPKQKCAPIVRGIHICVRECPFLCVMHAKVYSAQKCSLRTYSCNDARTYASFDLICVILIIMICHKNTYSCNDARTYVRWDKICVIMNILMCYKKIFMSKYSWYVQVGRYVFSFRIDICINICAYVLVSYLYVHRKKMKIQYWNVVFDLFLKHWYL